MAKWKPRDIIVRAELGQWCHPIVILSEHTFPNGELAYRFRAAIPSCDYDDDTEHWPKDGYGSQDYLDQYRLLWREQGEGDLEMFKKRKNI